MQWDSRYYTKYNLTKHIEEYKVSNKKFKVF